MSKRAGRKPATSKRPRSKLGLPDLDHSKAAVLDSLRSPESKRGFQHAIDEFIQRYCSEPRLSLNKVAVTRFRIFTFAFLWVYAAFFTCIWVWLHAGSGLALKMLRPAGGIIEWLTLKLDIENKPLQSLGLVAGAVVACVYWSASILNRLLRS